MPKFKKMAIVLAFLFTVLCGSELIGIPQYRNEVQAKTTKKTVASKKTTTSKKTSTRTRSSRNSRGASSYSMSEMVVSYSKEYLGVPYVFGSSSSKSFDCSGFTMYVYKKVGISLPHSAKGQASMGTRVSKSELKPGDLVFFQTYTSGISHVGIYIGDGKFIHASSGAGHVVVTNLSDSYYTSRYRGATRLIK